VAQDRRFSAVEQGFDSPWGHRFAGTLALGSLLTLMTAINPTRGSLMRERIRAAAMRLVDSTASVKAVARELGYVDLYLFTRQFKQVMGRSPRVYRRLSE